MSKITLNRHDGFVKLSCFGPVDTADLINSCEDHDFSLDSYQTGHLMLLDDREEKTYMLNDHYLDVIDVLNEKGEFDARLSFLDYSEFKNDD